MKLTDAEKQILRKIFAALLAIVTITTMIIINPILLVITVVCAIFLLAFFVGFSYTELGPFSQLRSGGRLDRKTGKENIVGHYLNEPGYGIDSEGNIYEDKENEYLNNLRKNFFFRFFGMVYTGIPYFPIPGLGGTVGSWIKESTTKVSKNQLTGVIEVSVEELPPVYHKAPPIFIKQGIVLSGIPVRGSNLAEFGGSFTLRITNVHRYQYRVGDPTALVNDNFESMLRPKVATMEFEDVQKMSSEVGQGIQSTTLGEIKDLTDKALEKHGYGCVIHELNMPIIQPTGPYAEAVRKKEINEALRDADKPAVEQEVYRETETGAAKAKTRKALVEASQGNIGVHIEAGMSGLQPGATFVLGQGIMPSFPIGGNKPNKRGEDK